MPRVWGYTRVSDELQLGNKALLDGKIVDSTSLETQRHLIQRWWDSHQHLYPTHEFAGVFEDPAKSAMKYPLPKRPQGAHLMACVQPGDIIVAADQERVFRNPKDFFDVTDLFRKMKVRLVFIDAPGIDILTDDGEALSGIKAVLKQMEAKSTARRNRAAYRSKEERGIVCGGFVPPGYKRIHRYDPVTKKVLKGNVPCKGERMLFRILAHISREDFDPKNRKREWTVEKFNKYVKQTPNFRRHNGVRLKWQHLRIAPYIVSHDFPVVNLITVNRGFYHERMPGSGVRDRSKLPPSSRKPTSKMPSNWAVELWKAEGNVSAQKQRHSLCPEPIHEIPSVARPVPPRDGKSGQ